MENLKGLYFGFWAQMAQYPIQVRAAVVIAVGLILLWPLVRLLLPKLQALFFLAAAGVNVTVFLLKRGLFYEPMRKRNPAWTARCNQYDERSRRKTTVLLELSRTAWSRKFRYRPGQLALVYCLIMLLFFLPGILGAVMHPRYVGLFSPVYRLYCTLERGPLRQAAGYEPLFVASPEAAAEPEPTEAPEPALPRLQLSERGRKRGANVRSGPGEAYSIIGGVSGDATMALLDDENEHWVNILLDDGTVGWIHRTLVEAAARAPRRSPGL